MKQYFLGGIIQYLIQLHYMNPFAALDIQDEEEDFKQVPQQPKPTKKTHQQRKEAKERKIKEAQTAKTVSNVNENIEEVGKEKKQKHYKERPLKGVPEGHTHDRRSGTGRHDRPRKEGGGKGNVGNVKDEMNKEKYIKQNETEDKVQEEEEKPEEPQPITLDQYYKNKGIEIDEHLPKEPVKKGEINAEWIKKENLTLMKTKEDMRKEAGGSEYTKKSFNSSLGGNQQHSQMLGFGNKKTRQEKKDREREEEKPHPKKKKEKVVLKEEDFPTL